MSVKREHFADCFPEFFGVIHFDEVRQFMGDDVVDDGKRGHDEAPVEVEVFLAAAGAPTGFGFGDRYGAKV